MEAYSASDYPPGTCVGSQWTQTCHLASLRVCRYSIIRLWLTSNFHTYFATVLLICHSTFHHHYLWNSNAPFHTRCTFGGHYIILSTFSEVTQSKYESTKVPPPPSMSHFPHNQPLFINQFNHYHPTVKAWWRSWERIGLISQRSLDRDQVVLEILFFPFLCWHCLHKVPFTMDCFQVFGVSWCMPWYDYWKSSTLDEI